MVTYFEKQRPKSRSYKLGLVLLMAQFIYIFIHIFPVIISNELFLIGSIILGVPLFSLLIAMLLFEARLKCNLLGVSVKFWPFKSYLFNWNEISYIECTNAKKMKQKDIEVLFYNVHNRIFGIKGVIIHLVSGHKIYVGCKDPLMVLQVAREYYVDNELGLKVDV